MSRIVQPRNHPLAFTGRAPADPPPDRGNLDNLLKYVPIEILAPYLVIANFLKAPISLTNLWIYGIATLICLVAVPFYLRMRAEPGDPWPFHAVVSTFAFVIWAYAAGGLAEYADAVLKTRFFQPPVAALLLFAFSILSLFLAPKAKPAPIDS